MARCVQRSERRLRRDISSASPVSVSQGGRIAEIELIALTTGSGSLISLRLPERADLLSGQTCVPTAYQPVCPPQLRVTSPGLRVRPSATWMCAGRLPCTQIMDLPPSKNPKNAALRSRLIEEVGGPHDALAREAILALAKHPNSVNTVAKASMLFGFEGGLLDIAAKFFASRQQSSPPAPPVIAIDLSPVARKRPREPIVILDHDSPVQLAPPHLKALPFSAPPAVIANAEKSRAAVPVRSQSYSATAAPPPDSHAGGRSSAAAASPPHSHAGGRSSAPPAVAPVTVEPPDQFSCSCCSRIADYSWTPIEGVALDLSTSASSSAPGRSASSAAWHQCALDVHNWDVVLLLDTREVAGRTDRSYMSAQLLSAGVNVEVRSLVVGDMMWVARRRQWSHGVAFSHAAPQELRDMALGLPDPVSNVKPTRKQRAAATAAIAKYSSNCGAQHDYPLNFLIERKTCVDLEASIIDGRYFEQKARLAATGLRVTYVIEGDPTKLNNRGFQRLTPKHLTTSMVTTAVANGFHVVTTHSIDATISWLARMHGAILGLLNKTSKCSVASCPQAAEALSAGSGAAGRRGGDPGHANRSSPALRLTQAASSMAADVCDPFALIGRGASPARMHAPSRAHTPAARSAAATAPPPRLCCNDRCNLQGRACFPTRLRTFEELSEEAGKPRVLTVRELFGRFLCQVKGMSAERAEAVLAVYPTPRLLAEAYDALPSDDARAGMIKGLAVPGQRNTLGPALSAAVHVFFNAEHRYPGAPALVPPSAGGGAALPPPPGAAAFGAPEEGGAEEDEDDMDEPEWFKSGAASAWPPPAAAPPASRGRGRGGAGRGRGRSSDSAGGAGEPGENGPGSSRGGRGAGYRGGGRGAWFARNAAHRGGRRPGS